MSYKTDTCILNAEFFHVTASGTYTYHRDLNLPPPGKLAHRRLFTPSIVFVVHPEFIRFGRELGYVPEQNLLSASLQLLVTGEIFLRSFIIIKSKA
jgi:hypothetical protein